MSRHIAMNAFKYKVIYVLATLCPMTIADMNGMNMNMDGAMSLAAGHMLPYLHFTPGDNLWFFGWVPASTGAMVGTCIGLFLLGMVERWIAACRAIMEAHWRTRAQIALSDRRNSTRMSVKLPSEKRQSPPPSPTASMISMRIAPPFIPTHDIARGILHVAQSALGFAFMLTVMTFQIGFILAIVVGLGVGETLFGRYIYAASHI